MDDRLCTRCHENIELHSDGKLSLRDDARQVTRFDLQHPEFPPPKEPGNLKFSHYRHTRPGITERDGDMGAYKLSDIRDPQQRKRYARGEDKPDALVRLECASCHLLDTNDFGEAKGFGIALEALPFRSSSGYVLPITYENQCQACHPLYDTPGVIQHRQSLREIRDALRRELARQSVFGDPELLRRTLPPDLPNRRPLENETVKEGIDRNLSIAEAKLRQEYCGKCHEFDGSELQPKLPAKFAQIRLEHATFDHRAHRAIDCATCHKEVIASRSADDNLLPKRSVCINCHSPAFQVGGKPTGAPWFDCVECHRYHNDSQPLAGSSSQAENPNQTLSIKEFESGTHDRKQ